MWKLGLGILFSKKKKFGTALSMWTCTQLLPAKYCNLLRKAKLQNAYSPHTPPSFREKNIYISSLAELNWLFTSFHGHKGLILRSLESPVPAVMGLLGTVSFPPQHTQNALTAVLWSENAQEKEDVKEVSSVISFQRGERRRTGQCIWVLRTKPETQCNRWLWVTRFCSLYLSQHHWHLHFTVWRCQGKCVVSIPASPTEQWLCHFEISVGVDPFPNRFLKSPLGMFIFNIYVILVLCGYFLPVSGLLFISLVEIRV